MAGMVSPPAGLNGEPQLFWKNNIPLAAAACAARYNPPTKESPAMSKPVAYNAYINAGHRFEFYDDHTKVFALDDPTGMALSAYPPGVPAPEPRAEVIRNGRIVDLTASQRNDLEQGIKQGKFTLWPEIEAAADRNTARYLDALGAGATLFHIDGVPVSKEYWDGFQRGRKTAFAQHDSDDVCIPQAHAAERTLQRLGYTWAGGKEWAPPIGKRPAWLDATPPTPYGEAVTAAADSTKVIAIGDLHQRICQLEDMMRARDQKERA